MHELRLRMLVEQSPVSMQVVSPEGRTLHVNPAFERLWGVRAEDLRDYDMLADPQLAASGVLDYLRRALAGESVEIPPIRYDTARTLGTGRARHVAATVFPVKDDGGRVVEIVLLHHDVTEQTETQRALRERDEQTRAALAEADLERRRLAAVLEALPVGVWIADATGQLTHANRAAHAIWGGDAPMLDAGRFAEYRAWWPASGERLRSDEWALARVLRTAETIIGEPLDIERFDGTRGHVLNSAAPVRDVDGHVIGAVAVNLDVTAQQRAEADRTQLVRAVAAERARLAHVFEQAPAFIAVLRGPDHVFEFANQAYYQLVGFREVVGRPVREVLPEVASQGFLELLDGVLRSGEPYVGNGVSLLIRSTPGAPPEERVVNFVYQPIVELDGTRSGIFAHGVDVTEQVRAAEAARASAARFRALVEATAQIVWTMPPEGTFAGPQPGWTAFTGQDAPALLGWGWLEAVHPDDRERTRAAWQAAHAGSTVLETEHRLRRHDGVYRDCSVRAVPVLDDAGAVREWVGAHTDVTEAHRAAAFRARLQELTARLSIALTPAEVADVVVRESAAAVDAAASFLALLADDDPRSPRALRLVASRHYPEALQRAWADMSLDSEYAVAEAARTGQPVWLESSAAAERYPRVLEAYRDSGFHAWAVLPLVAEGRTLGVLGLVFRESRPFDASMRDFLQAIAARCAEAFLRARLYREARAASDAKSGFMATMSHELRTPINAIIGYVDLLLLGIPEPVPAVAQEQLGRVRTAARHLLGLIDEILTHSRLEAGRETVALEPVDLRLLADEVATVVEPLARERGLAFGVEMPDGPLLARTDAGKVRQILINLLGNAVKFTAAGQVALRVVADAAEVRFEVQDTGIGIAPADAARVFEPFWQVEQRPSQRSPGAGLGLSVTRRLARLLGGDVTVASTPGAGSTFTVRLPRRAGDE